MHGRRSVGGGSGGSGGAENYRNACLTMHQPWASLLVHGIKRIEGRSWPAPLRGRLWIHAASKVPETETIAAMENFYREIYAVDGITDINFPEHYPVSHLLGCVEVVGCLKGEELPCWEEVPESLRLEGLTDFCWLCEKPQKLVIPFEMRGYQGVYNLEKRIYESAVRALTPVEGPFPVKFPLPDPKNPFSLKPGSLVLSNSKASEVEKSRSVSAAIAGAQAATTQFSKKFEAVDEHTNTIQKHDNAQNKGTSVADQVNRAAYNLRKGRFQEDDQAVNPEKELMHSGSRQTRSHQSEMRIAVPPGAAKLFSAALNGMNKNR